MSLSKVIKVAAQKFQPFAGFSYDGFQGEHQPRHHGAADEFQSLFSHNHGVGKESGHPNAAGSYPVEGLQGTGPEELQRLLQDSCDRGFADGRREAEESFEVVCRTLSEVIVAVNGLRERILRECEDDLLRLSMVIAKQIVRQEISQDKKILAQFVSEATSGISDHNDIVICFNPEDYRTVSSNRQLYLAGVDDKVQVTIKPDDSISIGGCIVETQTGHVDARVETQLAEIFKRLMQERGQCCDGSLELPTEAELYQAKQSGAEKYGHQRD